MGSPGGYLEWKKESSTTSIFDNYRTSSGTRFGKPFETVWNGLTLINDYETLYIKSHEPDLFWDFIDFFLFMWLLVKRFVISNWSKTVSNRFKTFPKPCPGAGPIIIKNWRSRTFYFPFQITIWTFYPCAQSTKIKLHNFEKPGYFKLNVWKMDVLVLVLVMDN